MTDITRGLVDCVNLRARQSPVGAAFTEVTFPGIRVEGARRTLTWSQLRRRALVVAGQLSGYVSPGDRVAIMLPQGLDYVTAFLACLYVRAIAVPLPAHGRQPARAARVLADCAPAVVLADARSSSDVRQWTKEQGLGCRTVLPVDDLPDSVPRGAFPPTDPGSVAYLHYTSGTGGATVGLMVSHSSLATNARQAARAYLAGLDATKVTGVSWLPLFQGLGLVMGIALPLIAGFPSTLMDQSAFLQKPLRWLRLLSESPGAITAAPNSAYDYCVDRIRYADAQSVELSRVGTLISSGEPVRASTLRRFQRAFGPAGLRPEALCPSYSLAAGTALVSAKPMGTRPQEFRFKRSTLTQGLLGNASADDRAAVRVVSCGTPTGQRVCVVRSGSRTLADDGEIGEVLVRGPNVADGYWNHRQMSARTFGIAVRGAPGRWMRTGDIGAMHNGQLLVTARGEELITVGGRVHAPYEVEEDVQRAIRWIERDRLAAFSIRSPGAASDRAVVVAEYRRGAAPREDDRRKAARMARLIVSRRHGLHLSSVELFPPGSLPRTPSGAVSRSACRKMYVKGW
ncbi:fatty acyl-AMP ligase [Streptomyces sp. NPDC050658]|uniref:fatty acyl-AMP ligase n=1 Tax=unclassified Streptomyces TaxID=2593676 RepID=UPI003441B7C1